MAEAVYILCAFTSIGCAWLLLRKYQATRTALLWWTAIGFCAFALNNILLVIDLMLVPGIDLLTLRTSVMLCGFLALLYGLIWERV